MLLPGQTLYNGKYAITCQLAGGGMNLAYLAEERLPGNSRQVVIKEFSHIHQARLEQEIRALIGLRNENLVSIYTCFKENQSFYMVLEYINGGSLFQIVQDHKNRVPVAQLINWFSQLCDGLTYLHTRPKPILHQDIAPDNVAIRMPEDTAVILDFGISRFVSEGSGLTERMGKEGYAPIEQYTGKVDVRSDIYALGCTLYFCLTGQTPLSAGDRAGGKQLPPPQTLNPGIPIEVSTIVMRAIEMQPERRFQSAMDFKNALAECAQPTLFRTAETFYSYLLNGPVAREQGAQMLRQGKLLMLTRKLSGNKDDLSQANAEPDDGIALELAARALGKPATSVELRTNLDKVNTSLKHGTDAVLEVEHLSGRDTYFGLIRQVVPWVIVEQPRFICYPGEVKKINIKVDYSGYNRVLDRQRGLRLRPVDPISIIRL